jgi:hypothetical protein
MAGLQVLIIAQQGQGIGGTASLDRLFQTLKRDQHGHSFPVLKGSKPTRSERVEVGDLESDLPFCRTAQAQMLQDRQCCVALEDLPESREDGVEFGHGQFDFHGVSFRCGLG